MKEENLDKQYMGGLTNLLCYFLEDTYLPPEEVDDHKTIKRYVATFDKKVLEKTMTQALEVLALYDFPDEWIGNTANRYYKDKQAYKEWIKWIVDTLEQEAKKQGKLQIERANEQKTFIR